MLRRAGAAKAGDRGNRGAGVLQLVIHPVLRLRTMVLMYVWWVTAATGKGPAAKNVDLWADLWFKFRDSKQSLLLLRPLYYYCINTVLLLYYITGKKLVKLGMDMSWETKDRPEHAWNTSVLYLYNYYQPYNDNDNSDVD